MVGPESTAQGYCKTPAKAGTVAGTTLHVNSEATLPARSPGLAAIHLGPSSPGRDQASASAQSPSLDLGAAAGTRLGPDQQCGLVGAGRPARGGPPCRRSSSPLSSQRRSASLQPRPRSVLPACRAAAAGRQRNSWLRLQTAGSGEFHAAAPHDRQQLRDWLAHNREVVAHPARAFGLFAARIRDRLLYARVCLAYRSLTV